ncbi:hypothetical protein [Jatrophihabitans endophyticus]|uniref:hypothetical protein n=1 Tax=Jatrophihabitans endophyticus TaxID=1206085 RepID=UPI001A0CAD7A|nr:hypothetical protein [Jatrophihabitans endophyticus]MBE7188603.1 hypothetical protein [Jatrophihabitans endophyticus]
MSEHLSRSEQVKLLLLPRRSVETPRRTTASAELAATGRAQRAAAATKILTRPRWLVFHVVIWALAAIFIGLGLWQLSVSNAKHFDFFNFQYALQWWLFAAFGLFVWIRIMQHRLDPPQSITPRGGTVMGTDRAVAVRPGSTTLMVSGAAGRGERPIVYRGYVAPQSSEMPVRSHGDALHNAYNDFLWQLGVADGATPDVGPRTGNPVDGRRPDSIDPGPAGPGIP